MEHYLKAAQQAHSQLMPMVDAAIADASSRLDKAIATAERELITQQLVDLLNNAGRPSSDAVGGMIATYTAMLSKPVKLEGSVLLGLLSSTVKNHRLSDGQAAQIAGAMLAAIHGKAQACLIPWPPAKTWHKELSYAALQEWAAWLAPTEYAELMASLESAAKARISAETDLMQLNRARQSLTGIVPQSVSSDFVRIRNNATHNQGVVGVRWLAGETLEVAPNDYARMAATEGFKRLTDTGVLELIA